MLGFMLSSFRAVNSDQLILFSVLILLSIPPLSVHFLLWSKQVRMIGIV
jgi:hypothetical protein